MKWVEKQPLSKENKEKLKDFLKACRTVKKKKKPVKKWGVSSVFSYCVCRGTTRTVSATDFFLQTVFLLPVFSVESQWKVSSVFDEISLKTSAMNVLCSSALGFIIIPVLQALGERVWTSLFLLLWSTVYCITILRHHFLSVYFFILLPCLFHFLFPFCFLLKCD